MFKNPDFSHLDFIIFINFKYRNIFFYLDQCFLISATLKQVDFKAKELWELAKERYNLEVRRNFLILRAIIFGIACLLRL